MPDDTTDLDVELTRNDGSEEFYLKGVKVNRSLGNNLVTAGVLGVAGDMTGKQVKLGFETYKIDGQIQNTQQGTYPTGGGYPDIDLSTWGRATEKEMALRHAGRTWKPDSSDGFDVLSWGPRTLDGMISKLTTTGNREKKAPEQYTFTLEWTHANRYVGDD
jgi:hypothetical protein